MSLHPAQDLTNEKTERSASGKNRFVNSCFEWVEALIAALIAAVLVFTLCFRIANVSGPSMLPALKSGDRIVLSAWPYRPHRNDVVVIAHTEKIHEPIVKRVIALENEVVDIDFQTGVVSVDGRPLEESDDLRKGVTEQRSDYVFPLTVPKGHVFVLGDNRSVSDDSRFCDVGMVDVHTIMGKAECVLFPFDRAGLVK